MEAWLLLLAIGLFAFLGSLFGIITGLAPGIHVNNVALLVVVFQGSLAAFVSSLFAGASPNAEETLLMLSALVVGTLVTSTFLDFIPSIFLGAPDPATALSVLPGHRLLLEGRGYEAVRLSALGCFASFLISLALILPVRLIMGSPVLAYDKLRPDIAYVLLLVEALLIFTEGPRRATESKSAPGPRPTAADYLWTKGWALMVFLIGGGLGWAVLDSPGLMAQNWYPLPSLATDLSSIALFPLFTGMFGLSTLILSVGEVNRIPPQRLEPGPLGLSRRRQVRGVLAGSVAGAFVGWLPGVSGGSGTMIGRLLAGSGSDEEDQGASTREFLISAAGVNTATAVFSLVALFIILRARSGAAAAVQKLATSSVVAWEPLMQVPQALPLLLFAAAVAAILGLVYTLALARFFIGILTKLPYRAVVVSIIAMLVALLFLISGPLGLAIALVSTLIGFIPALVGVRRVHLMGVLVIPVIIFFLTH